MIVPDDPIGAREARTIRDERIADLVAWAKADPTHSIGANAARLGIKGGRPWSAFTDDELSSLWFWCVRGDHRTDDKFDSDIPF